MKLTMKQTVEQKQILSLSLFQIQSLSVLSLGNTEIGGLLKQEYTENPFLEQKEAFSCEEQQWLKYYKETIKSSSPVLSLGGDREEKDYQGAGICDFDWKQDVREQLYRKNEASQHIRCMEGLIELLDDHGFLNQEETELCQIFHVSKAELHLCKMELAELEPAGLGCRGIGEYFLFQIRRKGIQVPKAFEVLCLNYLDDITKKTYSQIAQQLQTPFQDVRRWIQLLGTLNPYPVDAAKEEHAEYIVPDITIELMDGEWNIKVNDYYMRQYCISDFYCGMRRQSENAEMREYMDRKLLRAKQLCEAITKRNQTVWSMGDYLLQVQKSFFEGGFLCGLTYKMCAEALGVHESTVCRLVANKYVLCPQGILPLNYFFSKGVKRFDEHGYEMETMGKTSVKELIAGYIGQESRQKPLSDTKIAQRLNEEYGLQISKRTVANYREEMGIHSVYERKMNLEKNQ